MASIAELISSWSGLALEDSSILSIPFAMERSPAGKIASSKNFSSTNMASSKLSKNKLYDLARKRDTSRVDVETGIDSFVHLALLRQ